MASVRFADLRTRPTELLDFTSVTLDEWSRTSGLRIMFRDCSQVP
jgi:hypothetical protein